MCIYKNICRLTDQSWWKFFNLSAVIKDKKGCMYSKISLFIYREKAVIMISIKISNYCYDQRYIFEWYEFSNHVVKSTRSAQKEGTHHLTPKYFRIILANRDVNSKNYTRNSFLKLIRLSHPKPLCGLRYYVHDML